MSKYRPALTQILETVLAKAETQKGKVDIDALVESCGESVHDLFVDMMRDKLDEMDMMGEMPMFGGDDEDDMGETTDNMDEIDREINGGFGEAGEDAISNDDLDSLGSALDKLNLGPNEEDDPFGDEEEDFDDFGDEDDEFSDEEGDEGDDEEDDEFSDDEDDEGDEEEDDEFSDEFDAEMDDDAGDGGDDMEDDDFEDLDDEDDDL